MKKNPTLWFTRSHGTVRGPFTSATIKNNLLLGRLNPKEDSISSDQVNWQLISSQIQFYSPHTETDTTQSKLHLNERNGFDRRELQSTENTTLQHRSVDRRKPESRDEIQHRQFQTLLMHKLRHQHSATFWPLVILFSVLAIISILAIIYSKPFPAPSATCHLAPKAGIDWSNCLKPQLNFPNSDFTNSQLRNSQLAGSNFMNSSFTDSDLAYTDLRFSNFSYSQMQNVLLLGANLKNADLSYTDLSNADLSYTNLTNANLGESKLENARFDHAIWINGEMCAVGSVGQCVIAKAPTP